MASIENNVTLGRPLNTSSEEDEYIHSLNCIYYHLRITFSDQTEKHEYIEDKEKLKRWKYISKQIKEVLLNYAQYGKITGGLETKNKIDEHTRGHVHFAFASTSRKDTIIKPVKRLLNDMYDMSTTGNKYFYFKAKPEPDVDRIFRYPLKQALVPSLCSGFTSSQLQILHQGAHDSYLTTIQVNQKKMDNRDTSDTLFLRLCDVLKKEKLKIYKEIVSRAIRFYCEEDRPLNRQVITGYALTYQVKEKIRSTDDLADEWC